MPSCSINMTAALVPKSPLPTLPISSPSPAASSIATPRQWPKKTLNLISSITSGSKKKMRTSLEYEQMISKLKTLSRKQLEQLVFYLSKEIGRLEEEFQDQTSNQLASPKTQRVVHHDSFNNDVNCCHKGKGDRRQKSKSNQSCNVYNDVEVSHARKRDCLRKAKTELTASHPEAVAALDKSVVKNAAICCVSESGDASSDICTEDLFIVNVELDGASQRLQKTSKIKYKENCDNPNHGVSLISPKTECDAILQSAEDRSEQIFNDNGVSALPTGGSFESNEKCKCTSCDMTFSTGSNCRRHIRNIHGGQMFSCEICGKVFRHKHNLQSHAKVCLEHSAAVCPHCSKLVKPARLKAHMQKVHENPCYTCQICKKGFLRLECFEGHMNKHDNNTPHKCCCGRQYRYLSSLYNHRKFCTKLAIPLHLQAQSSPSDKDQPFPFICETCGCSFKRLSSLKDHRLAKHSHMPYTCTLCQKSFTWRPSFNRHIKKCTQKTDAQQEASKSSTHVDSSSRSLFVCVCGKKYFYRQSQLRHQKNCWYKLQLNGSACQSHVIG